MTRFFRPNIARMAGYVPGEQPRDGGFIKLNTNENPYPPSPRVKAAIAEAVTDRLRLYPDPMSTAFCRAAARLHGIEPEMVLAGNGSDDVLTIVTRAFVGPGDPAAFATPSYLLYSTLIQLQDGRAVTVPYSQRLDARPERPGRPRAEAGLHRQPRQPLRHRHAARAGRRAAAGRSTAPCWSTRPTPTSPTRDTTACPLLRDHPNLIVSRSFSKGYSLAGIRLGYLAAPPRWSSTWSRSRTRTTATCSARSRASPRSRIRTIWPRRGRRCWRPAPGSPPRSVAFGYEVPDSQSNFVWATGGAPARETFRQLKERRILVRLMSYPGYPEGLRISVGTDEEIDRLLEALRQIL